MGAPILRIAVLIELARPGASMLCTEGSYSLTGGECQPCERHAWCPGGASLVARQGYWRADFWTSDIKGCPYPRFCSDPGSDLVATWNGTTPTSYLPSDSQCKGGHHQGPLCATCEGGFRLDSVTGVCHACGRDDRRSTTAARVLLALFVAIALGLVFLRRWCSIEVMGVAKATIIFFQLTSSLSWSFPSVNVPSVFEHYEVIAGVAGLDVANLFKRACVGGDLDHLDLMVVATVAPIVIAAAIVAVTSLLSYVSRSRRVTTHALLVALSYVVLTTASRYVAQTFRCDTSLDDRDDELKDYLYADYSVSCQNRRYRYHRVYAALMVVVYPVGIPLLYLAQLLAIRSKVAPRDYESLAALLAGRADNEEARHQRLAAWHRSTKLWAGTATYHDELAQTWCKVRALAELYLVELGKKDNHSGDHTSSPGAASYDESSPRISVVVAPDESRQVSCRDVVRIADAASLDAIGEALALSSRRLEDDCRAAALLWQDFDPPHWYFELIVCAFRLVLTCLFPLPGVDRDSLSQLALGLALVSVFAAAFAVLKPYARLTLELYATALALLLVLNVFCFLLLFADDNIDDNDNATGIRPKHFGLFLVYVDCGALVLAGFALVCDTKADARLRRLESRRLERRPPDDELGRISEQGVIHPQDEDDTADSVAHSDEFHQDVVIGESVTICGLETRPEMNGRVGYIENFDAAAGRYTVVCDDGVYLLKPQNVIQGDFLVDYDSLPHSVP